MKYTFLRPYQQVNKSSIFDYDISAGMHLNGLTRKFYEVNNHGYCTYYYLLLELINKYPSYAYI